MRNRHSPVLFQFPWLEKFTSACQKIEADPHYQPCVTDEEFDRFLDKHTRPTLLIRGAFAKNETSAGDFEKEPSGAVYHLIRFLRGCDDSGSSYWFKDAILVLLVNEKGDYSFHNYEAAANGNYNNPLTGLKIDKFLNNNLQHYSKPKSNHHDQKPNYIKNLSDSHRTEVKKSHR